jgi:hypothetical protein
MDGMVRKECTGFLWGYFVNQNGGEEQGTHGAPHGLD